MKDEKVTYTTLADFAEWELEAYADGVAIPHLAQFLAGNPAAAATWQREQQIMTHLQTMLHRFDCPAAEMLQAYHWQDLSPAEQAQVQAHLQLCPHCREELRQLRAFLTPPKPVTAKQPAPPVATGGWREQLQDALDQLRLVVANLLTPPTPQFAGVALRGEADAAASATPHSLFFEAEETAISLLIQKEVSGTLLLSGQILAVMPSTQSVVKLIPQAAELPPASTPADTLGNFTFAHLHPGSYQLQIVLDDTLVVIPAFTL